MLKLEALGISNKIQSRVTQGMVSVEVGSQILADIAVIVLSILSSTGFAPTTLSLVAILSTILFKNGK